MIPSLSSPVMSTRMAMPAFLMFSHSSAVVASPASASQPSSCPDPDDFEVTFSPQVGLRAADDMALFRSAVKQMCRRQGCFRARLSAKPWRIGIRDRLRRRAWPWPEEFWRRTGTMSRRKLFRIMNYEL